MKFKTLKFNIQEQNIFFTADTHLAHDNIIKYCNRHFGDVYKMDETIVENWNNKVNPKDIIFILGDFCFGSQKTWIHFLNKLQGKKYLIIGNHDRSITPDRFIQVTPLLNILIRGDEEMPAEGQRITLCHYPMISWYHSHRGSWQLYGHVHGVFTGTERISPNQLDVGVDIHNFTPISYDEVKTIITKQNLAK